MTTEIEKAAERVAKLRAQAEKLSGPLADAQAQLQDAQEAELVRRAERSAEYNCGVATHGVSEPTAPLAPVTMRTHDLLNCSLKSHGSRRTSNTGRHVTSAVTSSRKPSEHRPHWASLSLHPSSVGTTRRSLKRS
ncbi:hypothetical protein OG275_31140 [Streptomyces niveus]|uniref:hypothetical protein n=1 Tax=Streptomyces niveus TaxID=193462 RepID=UPI002E33ED93|nr:hypothetical protein [Streptomyces niveus]